MLKNLFRVTAVVGTACLLLAVTSSAKALTITAQGQLIPGTYDPDTNTYSQPGSTFDTTIDLTGTFGVTGNGYAYNTKATKTNPNPQPFKVTGVGYTDELGNHIPPSPGAPTALVTLYNGAVSTSSSPTDLNAGADYTLTDPNLKTLADVQNLDVDLLNGVTGDFAINTLDIYTNSLVTLIKDITIDLNGSLSGLTFAETGATLFTPTGVGTGTFSIDGDLSATISNLFVTALSIIGLPIPDVTLTTPFTLAGTYTVSTTTGGRHIALDGSVLLAVPLSLQTNLTTELSTPAQLTISTTIDLLASLTVAVGYHLETNVVPEPGSFILLGIGLAALIPVLRLRRKS